MQASTTRLTYGQLLEHLKRLGEDELKMEVSIHDLNSNNHLSVDSFKFASYSQDFYDIGYPYLCGVKNK